MNYFDGLSILFILLISPAATIVYAVAVAVFYCYFVTDFFAWRGPVRKSTKFWLLTGAVVVWIIALNHIFFVAANFENKLWWVAP